MIDGTPEHMSATGELVSTVMERHRVTPNEVAIHTTYSAAHVRRMANGTYPLTIDVFRFLYQRTQDRELLEIATGELADTPEPGVSLSEARYQLLLNTHTLGSKLATQMSSETTDHGETALLSAIADQRAHLARLEAAINCRPREPRLEATG